MSTKKIEIWMEGYRATGDSATASKIFECEADDFHDAVKSYELSHPDSKVDYNNDWQNPVYSIWGCRLFDNEKDARKHFG